MTTFSDRQRSSESVEPRLEGVFKIGEAYTFVGYQARDGSPMAFLESLTGPDGKTVKIWFGDPNAN